MTQRKLKLLSIAPSESIQNQLHEITASMDHVHMDSFIGNLYSAVEIVRQRASYDYDAILSRGETASMIKKVTQIPVIEFPISFYDVLHAIKLAENFNEPFAIVGFTPVTTNAHLLRELLQLDLDIYTLFSLEDAIPLMEQLKNKGYHLIVSGMGIDAIARRNGINSILVTTGRESLSSAVDNAIRLCTSLVKIKQQENFLHQLLLKGDQELLVFNHKKELIFSSIKTLKKELALSLASKRLQNVERIDSVSTKLDRDMIITIQEKNIDIDDEPYTVFTFSLSKKPFSISKNEIRYFSHDEAVDTFLSHYLEVSSSGHDCVSSMPRIIQSTFPVMILGEQGIGKEQLATTIYCRSKHRNRPYLVIDFSTADDKTWTYLQKNVNSPINDGSITIYFRGLEKLTPAKTDKLKHLLYDTGTCRRNRVIFSYTTAPGTSIPNHIQNVINQFSCLTIHMTPLRDRASEIAALASLYISTVNIDLAKQVSGFTPQAIELMEQYSWPGNLTQFKRVITQLVTTATSPYIQAENVKRLLTAEDTAATDSPSLSNVLNIGKSLHDIERDIVKAVLAECGGNQSQAAARLGICRTTLWRIIKE